MTFRYKVGQLVYFDKNHLDIGYIEKCEWLNRKKYELNEYKVYWFSDGECSTMHEEDLNEVQT